MMFTRSLTVIIHSAVPLNIMLCLGIHRKVNSVIEGQFYKRIIGE